MSRPSCADYAITPQILLRAYSIGLFPMAESAEEEQLFWVDPQERAIFPLDAFKVSRSLAKTIRSDRFEVRVDTDFDAVIDACAASAPKRENTWINAEIRRLYRELFDMGFVHTVECWREGGWSAASMASRCARPSSARACSTARPTPPKWRWRISSRGSSRAASACSTRNS